MEKKNKKSSHITIDGEDYEMINVVSNSGELIASITSKNIIEKKDFEVRLIKDLSKIRFKETNANNKGGDEMEIAKKVITLSVDDDSVKETCERIDAVTLHVRQLNDELEKTNQLLNQLACKN